MTASPSSRAAEATAAHLTQFTDEDMAYHEAGHAVVHHLNGGTVLRLSIDREDPRRGCQLAPLPASVQRADPQQALAQRFAVVVGGEAAATLHGTSDRIVTAGGRVDHETALRAAAEAGVAAAQASAMIDAEWNRVRDRLQEPAAWQLVETLAQALLRQKTLDAAQIAALLGR